MQTINMAPKAARGRKVAFGFLDADLRSLAAAELQRQQTIHPRIGLLGRNSRRVVLEGYSDHGKRFGLSQPGCCTRCRHGRLEFSVVECLLRRAQQANPGCGNLVEDLLRELCVLARLKRANKRHLLIGRSGDHVRVGFEQIDAQQPVMMWRLVLRRYAQPFVVRIEVFGGGRLGHYWPKPRLNGYLV